MKGYVHVYTGNGKGKTTAALGLALRATGADLKVYIGQFIKSGEFSEIKALKGLSGVTIEQFGNGRFIKGTPSADDISAAEEGLTKLKSALLSGDYDVVIADEANCAVSAGLYPVSQLLELIDLKPDNIELVFTGRNADNELIDKADLVTEMKEVKHYFNNEIMSRKGIER